MTTALHSCFPEVFRKQWQLSWHAVLKLWMAVAHHRFHPWDLTLPVEPEQIFEPRNYSSANCHLIPWAFRAPPLGTLFQQRTQQKQVATAATQLGNLSVSKQILIPEGLWKALRGGILPGFRYPQISLSNSSMSWWRGRETSRVQCFRKKYLKIVSCTDIHVEA